MESPSLVYNTLDSEDLTVVYPPLNTTNSAPSATVYPLFFNIVAYILTWYLYFSKSEGSPLKPVVDISPLALHLKS